MHTRNLHVVLEVGPKGISGPILYRMEHRSRKGSEVIGKHYTSEEVHALYPGFRVLGSYSVEKMWDREPIHTPKTLGSFNMVAARQVTPRPQRATAPRGLQLCPRPGNCRL
jgi:hypothetical protein